MQLKHKKRSVQLYFFIFRERGREGEREAGKHQCVVASHTPPTGDLAHNPSICPDWELNQRPFGSQGGTQSTEPHQPEVNVLNLKFRSTGTYIPPCSYLRK